MAGFETYSYLPGHIAQFKDGNVELKSDPTPKGTDSVVFLGTATDGPIMEPISVTPENASIFGKMTHENGVPNGATLLAKFEEAWQAGNRDIRLMRVTGKSAKLSLTGKPYTDAAQKVASQVLGTAVGNAATSFTLPNGGLELATVAVFVDGIELPTTAYSVDKGVQADLTVDENTEQYAQLHINGNVSNAEAAVSISYSFKYIDENGKEVYAEQNTLAVDSKMEPMILHAEDQDYLLDFKPRSNLHLYADGAEILNTNGSIYEIDLSDEDAALMTIKSSKYIRMGAYLEVKYSYDEIEVISPGIELESIYGGDIYNELKGEVKVEGGLVTILIEKPIAKKSELAEGPMEFRSTDYPTLQLLVNAINDHVYNNVVIARTNFPDRSTATLEPKPATFFSGGHNELKLSNEELYERLGGTRDEDGYLVTQGAYQILENYTVDFVVPLGVYADAELVGMYDNFAYQLALGCAVMSHYNNVTMGIIATSSPAEVDLRSIENHVQKLEELENEYYMRDRVGNIIKDGDGNVIDLGLYLQVVAGPDLLVENTRLGVVATNDPATYAGFVGTLPVYSAPTNKTVTGALGLRYEYSASQLNRLTAKRLVTFKRKSNGSVAVTDAMMAAHEGSDYSRLSTARAVKKAVAAVREVCEPFIGEANNTENRNSMAATISKRLDLMVEAKELTAYDFNINATLQMELMGEAQIDLALQAQHELRKITTIVSLTA